MELAFPLFREGNMNEIRTIDRTQALAPRYGAESIISLR